LSVSAPQDDRSVAAAPSVILVDISVDNISLDSAPGHRLTSATVMTVCIAARIRSKGGAAQPELHVW
jgi:hypothetical protein